MNDTIVAISTSLGVGAISIIRVSGPESIEIASSIFKGKNLNNVNSHTINYGYIINNDEIIDEVLVTVMRAPKTFTKEDIVEINCHGGIAPTKKILEILIQKGARLAEPGEFTQKAFINGRIDLIEAESIMNIINSNTQLQRKNAILGMNGNTSNYIKKIRQEILELLANIEVNIDYPEYTDIEEVTYKLIREKLEIYEEKLKNLLAISKNIKLINDGINTVIVGRPNVGKSSILNRFLNEERAIVSNIEGTTRDVIESKIVIDEIVLNLIDTAGIRNTTDEIEKIGVSKSLKYLEESDLIIAVFNIAEELNENDYEILELIKNKNNIIVLNKSDLKINKNTESILIKNKNFVYTNTIDINGLQNLINKIKNLFNLDSLQKNDNNILNSMRQIGIVENTLDILKDIKISIENNMPIDMVEIDIKHLWNKLGELTGEVYTNELLDQLFSQFCLGK